MDAAFTSIAFAEPERAETNLALLERRLPAALWSTLPTLLAQVPGPDEALNYLERYLRDTAASIAAYLGKNPTALHYLLVIFSYSRFLSETLVQQPDLITWLHRPPARAGSTGDTRLERLKSPDDLHEEFARFQATHFDQPPPVLLARFKRREYLRITLRDVLGLATLAETTLELSHLADVLLERALRIAEQKLANAYGRPQFTDSSARLHTARMAILSLGKLGGQELNYSSDIDVLFLYEREGETAGGSSGTISNAEFFVRLAHAVLKIVTEATPEGAVFRVDLRLRPEGSEGDLAISLSTALTYYRERAREWELQMLIKARASAGDLDLGRRFLRQTQPLIYRKEFNFAAVEAVLSAREEITRELERRRGAQAQRGVAWNVKLSPGGLRDIEFLTQCLQRLYGGMDPWLASPAAASTLLALQRLHDKNYLSGRDFFRLGTAYQFLRKVEHRLQLRDGLQSHTLPEAPPALELLARRSSVEPVGGRSAAEQLLHRIRQHFAEVREIYERILFPKLQREGAPTSPQATEEGDPATNPLLRRLRSERPAIAQTFTQARWSDDPYARRGLHQFLESALLDPALAAELEEHPDWILDAGEILARSDLIAEMLSRHPEEIRVAAAPESAEVRGQVAPAAGTLDEALAALRVAYRRSVLAALVRALRGASQPFDTFAPFTRLADEALTAALDLTARDVLGEASLEAAPFAAIALGRLGTSEMDIGSDADLIFVADEQLSGERREPWRRLAERFVNVVSSHTRQGLLFPVDTRLRPRGTEGEIVQSAAYVRDYFRGEAEGWEAATFLKARPVAGNRPLGAKLIHDVQAILMERFQAKRSQDGPGRGPQELARQLAHTRERLEKEVSKGHRTGEFQKSSGGYYDIDYILAFLFLTAASAPPGGHVLRQIAALESAGLLDATKAETLRSAARLYRSIDHAVRLITGSPAERLPEQALAARVAKLLDEWQILHGGNLARAIEDARQHVRTLYEQIVLAAGRG